MVRPLPLALVLCAAAGGLAGAGCGGSSSSSSGSSSNDPAAHAGPNTVVVKMANIAFDPQTATVKLGKTVRWVNEDNVPHNVTFTSGAHFHSADIGNGSVVEFKPTHTGVFKYVCTIHPGMDGELKVVR